MTVYIILAGIRIVFCYLFPLFSNAMIICAVRDFLGSRWFERLGGIVDGSKERDEGEDVYEGVEPHVRQWWVFDCASGILLVFAGLWKVFV